MPSLTAAAQSAPLARDAVRPDAQPSDSQPSSGRLFWNRIAPSLGVLSLASACALWTAKGRQVVDECYTHAALGDRSFTHLWHAIPHLGAADMPLYYLTLWPWSRLFGAGDLALRLYSSLAIGLALVLLTALLRRRFTAQAAFLGAAFGFLTSQMVLDENAQCRGYGLYLLLAVLAIAAWLRVAETARPTPRQLVLLLLSQAGLVLGHVLGLLFAGLMLLALLAADALERRFRPRVCLCLMAGWLALLPWVPAILASMAVGRPRSWIPAPHSGALLTGLTCWIFTSLYWPSYQRHPHFMMLGWLAALVCMVVLLFGALRILRAGPAARHPLLLLGLFLVAAPEFFFVLSRLAEPVFLPRYLILCALGVALLAAAWFEDHPLRSASAAGAVAALLLLLPLVSVALVRPETLDVAALDRIAAGRTVVCDWSRDYLLLHRYAPNAPQFEYVLDWPAALAGPLVATTDFHLMQNYRREGFYAGTLPDVSQVLARPSFLLLDDSETNWFQLRIAHNPRFASKLIAPLDARRRLLLIIQVAPTHGAQP